MTQTDPERRPNGRRFLFAQLQDSAVKPGTNTWNLFSDRRFKKNITPLDGALDNLLALHTATPRAAFRRARRTLRLRGEHPMPARHESPLRSSAPSTPRPTLLTPPESIPIPPRFRWLNRFANVGILLFVLLVAVRLWWGWTAQRQLAAKLAEYSAAHEAVTLEELSRRPLDDEDNAAWHLRSAAAALVNPQDFDAAVELLMQAEQADPNVLQRRLTENAACLQALHAARLAPQADWDHLISPATGGALSPWGTFTEARPQRRLIEHAAGMTVAQLLLAADGAAIETIRDMRAAAAHIRVRSAPLSYHLVAEASDRIALETLERALPRLHIGAPIVSRTEASGFATVVQLSALRDELLDERLAREGWRDGMLRWRMYRLFEASHELADCSLAAPWDAPENPEQWLLAPRTGPDAIYATDPLTGWAAVMDGDTWNRARALRAHSNYQIPYSPVDRLAFPTRWGAPTGIAVEAFRYLDGFAYRRTAATAIALRLYEFDHHRRPDTLEELVPGYLPALPRDPFDPNGGSFRYLRDAAPPVLYSVGDDGQDNGGARGHGPGRAVLDATDWCYYLNGDRPWESTRAPATPPPTSTSTPATRTATEPVSTSPQLAPGQ